MCDDDDDDDEGLGWFGHGTDTVRRLRTFINKVFNFLGIGIALYIIANVYTWVSNDAVIKNTVKCKFCRKRISEKVCYVLCFSLCQAGDLMGGADCECWQAQRCVNCTSWVDGREEQTN